MKLINRYIFMEFIRLSFAVLAGIVVLYLSVTFLKEADSFIKNKAGLLQIARYYLYSIPGMASQALPFATLIGTLLSLGGLSRHQEITAMRAGGVSLFGVITPVVIGGLLISAFAFLNNEVIMPQYTAKATQVKNVEVEKKQQRAIFQQRKLWLRGPDNSIANIDVVAPDRREMLGVNIYRLNPDFTVKERIIAHKLVWESDRWLLKDGRKYTPQNDTIAISSANDEVYNIVDKPADMSMIVKSAEEMNFTELWEYVRRLKSSGYRATRQEVDLYGKLAYPFASLLMVMIATPFSLIQVRSGGTARGIAMAVLISAIYWALTSGGRALGISGTIPPLYAAWFANVVFFVLSLAAIIRLQRSV